MNHNMLLSPFNVYFLNKFNIIILCNKNGPVVMNDAHNLTNANKFCNVRLHRYIFMKFKTVTFNPINLFKIFVQ